MLQMHSEIGGYGAGKRYGGIDFVAKYKEPLKSALKNAGIQFIRIE